MTASTSISTTTPAPAQSSPKPTPALSPGRQKLADAIQHLADAEADVAGLQLADRRALDIAHDAREAVAAAEQAIADVATARTADTMRALASPEGRQAPSAHSPTIAARAAHTAAVETMALAAGVRDAVAAELDRLRVFTVPARESMVASAIQAVAEEVEQRFEVLARSHRESWSSIRDRITNWKRALRHDPDAVPPL